MSPRSPMPLVAAASFIAGFGVAELTGVRAVGGVVMVLGGAWCARVALRTAGPAATVALVAIALGLFVVSHVLGHAIGAWPAVGVCAALLALVATALVRRPASGGGEDLGHRVRPQ